MAQSKPAVHAAPKWCYESADRILNEIHRDSEAPTRAEIADWIEDEFDRVPEREEKAIKLESRIVDLVAMSDGMFPELLRLREENVRAIASHDALVAALRDIVVRWQKMDEEQRDDDPVVMSLRKRYWGALQEKAEAALKLAEEQA